MGKQVVAYGFPDSASMGFALWMDTELAWAQGTHEYRPMGVAVIAKSDLFRQSDFRPMRPAPSEGSRTYRGLFASLGDLNAYLEKQRRPRRPVTRLRKKSLFK